MKTYKVSYYAYYCENGNNCASASFVLIKGNTFSEAENNFFKEYPFENTIIVEMELLNATQYAK